MKFIYAAITGLVVTLLLNSIFKKLIKKERKRYYPAWFTSIVFGIVLVAVSNYLLSLSWFSIGVGMAISVTIIELIFPTKIKK